VTISRKVSELPRPYAGEKRQAYISRCISYFRKKEHLTQDEAVGRAFGYAEEYWPASKKSKSKKPIRGTRAGK